jgi:hypothetical protein
VFRRVPHGTDLDLGASRGDTYDHPKAGHEKLVLGIDHFDHPAHHLLGSVKIRDHSVTQGPDGFYVFVCLSLHHTGGLSNSQRFSRVLVNGDYGRLVNHYLIVVDDDGIGGTQVNGKFLS